MTDLGSKLGNEPWRIVIIQVPYMCGPVLFMEGEWKKGINLKKERGSYLFPASGLLREDFGVLDNTGAAVENYNVDTWEGWTSSG